MGKGTASFGKHNKGASHGRCRRCGEHSYHLADAVCASCGFGKSAKRRSYAWQKK